MKNETIKAEEEYAKIKEKLLQLQAAIETIDRQAQQRQGLINDFIFYEGQRQILRSLFGFDPEENKEEIKEENKEDIN